MERRNIMTVTAQIDLDERRDEYKDIAMELFIEDLFGKFPEKDGIKNIAITKITL